MTSSSETDKQLVSFFRDLADSIESNNMSQEQLQQAGEFFVSWQFNKDNEEDTDSVDSVEPIDVIKFITMGWYIYKMINKSNSGPKNDPAHQDREQGLGSLVD